MSSVTADRNVTTSELVYCHACQNEWLRNEHGLECPECHSDAVEIIDEHSDPRDNIIDLDLDDDDDDEGNDVATSSPDNLPQHPLHHHNPWRTHTPDPADRDDTGIEHFEWSPGHGVRFSRTTYLSSTPAGVRNGRLNDPFTPLFQTFSNLIEGVNAQTRGHGQGGNFPDVEGPHGIHRPDHPHPYTHRHGSFNGPHGSRNFITATGRWPPPGQSPFPNHHTGNATHHVLAQLLGQMQATIAAQNPNNPGMHAMPGFLAQLFGAGRHGDAVYTDEALDRIISQMMEQTNPSSAPGPASAAAIEALPKKKIDKDMLGQDGKAECSVCMEPVELGEEVTELPCHHWFHGECVGAWLKEHDTCPHCRQGIMPKDGPADSAAPRSPNQAPRHVHNPLAGHPGFAQAFNNSNPHPRMPGQFPGTTSPNSASPTPPNPILQPGAFPQQEAPVPGASQHPPFPDAFNQFPGPHNNGGPNAAYPQHLNYSSGGNMPSRLPSSRSRREGSRRSSSASQRSRGNGEGSSGGGGGVTGWFRNLRGGSSGGNR